MFKRRDRKPILRAALEFLWPRGGWARAFHYVRHRLRRLPDSPERIARGIWAGVFTTFTPFYGVHFVVAGILAVIMRGNIFAALLSTFFGNPLTYIPIIATSMFTGYWMLGLDPSRLRFRPHQGMMSRRLASGSPMPRRPCGTTSRRSSRRTGRIGPACGCFMTRCSFPS
ncbi:MAG: DUF2062 domain-containing protein [Pseudomonadota bacterium]